MRKRSFISHILVGALAALGFAACGDEEEDYPVEYGSPRVDFQVKGVVTDEDGRALNNIRVVIRKAWDNTPIPLADDTVYTDVEGKFAGRESSMVGIDRQTVYFDDVDGEDNGGKFGADSVRLADVTPTQVKEPSGHWYQGAYEFDINKQLKKDEGEK